MNSGHTLLFAGMFLTLAAGAALAAPAVMARLCPAYFCRSRVILSAALMLLAWYYVRSERSLVEVNAHYAAGLPWALRLASLWAGSAGSLLLFAVFYVPVPLYYLYRQPGNRRAGLAALAVQAVMLLAVLLEAPFARFAGNIPEPVPVNLLLVNVWMVIHPPLLFAGHVLLLAAAIEGLTGSNPLRLRIFALLGLAFEGAGMFSGGLWAYQVLGWGGFWGWDPVENSSLIPWLCAAALVILQSSGKPWPGRAASTRTEAALALAGGFFVLAGVCSTRGGLFSDISVHAFAASATGNVFGVLALAGLLWGVWRLRLLPRAAGEPRNLPQMLLQQSALTIVLLAALVAAGTLLPPLRAG
jgi:cytochrome c-type biogenesis protein CcmF